VGRRRTYLRISSERTDGVSDLILWIVIFVVFFFGFRWLQKRKNKD
jgi:hypothetical protein